MYRWNELREEINKDKVRRSHLSRIASNVSVWACARVRVCEFSQACWLAS